MKVIIVFVLFLLGACSEESVSPLLYQVKPQAFAIEIPAEGELFAARATVISAPISRSGVQNIVWLAPEFSVVKAGDVIARFDGEMMQVKSRDTLNKMAIAQQEVVEKTGVLNTELKAINSDIAMVGKEKVFADDFSIDDVRILSKLEIIDALQNTVYLAAKQDYLHWKSDSFSNSSTGEMGLLEMKIQQKQDKLTQLTTSLTQLEIKAPHDGLLVYKANWRGEKPRTGQSVWPGHKIAELPNIKRMKAKLFVIEGEAIDLTEGKEVSLSLFAHVDKPFTGKVTAVASFPKSIKRGDPQKFFEVEVTLDQQNETLFVPGRKLAGKIIIGKAQNKLVVPLQSVFTKDNHVYVYVFEGNKFNMTEVVLGKANLSHVEVISGLTTGQQISLTDQGQS